VGTDLLIETTKAIGLRMAVENEFDNRSRQERALQTMINEKKSELDRSDSPLANY
jgi:hypothetical protein